MFCEWENNKRNTKIFALFLLEGLGDTEIKGIFGNRFIVEKWIFMA